MNLRLIEHFVTIAELGSLSKAEARLGVAQPSLSRSLRQLEAELQTALFYRHGRGLALTEAGRTFLHHCKAALQELAIGRAEVSHLNARPSGTVIIALPPGVAKVALVELARRFSEQMAGATLRVVEMFTGDVPEALATGRIDIGVFYQPPVQASIVAETVAYEDLHLVGNAEAPAVRGPTIRFDELAHLPLILPARHRGVRGLIDAEAERRGLEISVIVELDALATLLELTQSGMGYSVLPYGSAFDLISRGDLLASRLVDPQVTRSVVLSASSQRPLSAIARATIPLLKEVLRAAAPKARWRFTEHAQVPL